MTSDERAPTGSRALPDDARSLNMEAGSLAGLEGAQWYADQGVLDLTDVKLTSLEGVVFPEGLQGIVLGGPELKTLEGLKLPAGLQELDLRNAKSPSLAGVEFPSDLQELFVSYAPGEYRANKLSVIVERLPGLAGVALPASLQKLELRHIIVNTLKGMELPSGLQELVLDVGIAEQEEALELPAGLRRLHLTGLDLSKWEKWKLPEGLLELQLCETRLPRMADLELPEGLLGLNLYGTNLTSLDGVVLPSGLQHFSIADTEVASLDGVVLPAGLRGLYLNKTKLRRIPDSISQLKDLEYLNLAGLELEVLPIWLPELGIPFSREHGGRGICLCDTTVKGVDMSIFDQSQESIREWFREYIRSSLEKQFIYLCLDSSTSMAAHMEFNLSNIFAEWSKNERRWEFVLFDKSLWDQRHLPEYIKPRFGFEPFDFGKYYYPDRFPDKFKPLPKAEEGLFRWVCGRYTLPGGFANKEWEYESYPKIYKARTPLYFDAPVEQEDKPLNEVKVVFLGDGGAGKSHTIARLLNDGVQTEDFPNISTPGIVITDKDYTINRRNIKVHFWDFGGQEILHSMHRMFLTKRTLYVVMVNVRDGNQDERARYWLHNLKSFADGAPVLLVLNQMDMNKNASINESDLRKLYPGLTEVVKLSTLTYSDERFRSEFIDVLRKQIGGMEILDLPLTAAGRRVKEKLRTMAESYIHGDVFQKFCDDSGVKSIDKVRRDLLEQFGQLGVSFCYSDSMELKDHVVLKPAWITNAIYIILFNKVEAVQNGLVSHDTIYEMLTSEDTEAIRRTVTDAAYTRDEVDYVLKVFRKFRLSFMVEDENTEFLPMLCDAKTTAAAAEYENDPNALEFRMHYEYLPGNVIHRLMVDRRKELDRSNVWLTGARFVCGDTGRSAVVKSEGNLIRILVRADKDPRDPQRYLDELKESLERINEIMGLTVSHMEVVYKEDGKTACFDYADLMFAQDMGETQILCRELRKKIRLVDVLMQSDFPEDEKQKKLMADIRQACEKLQSRMIYWDASEDVRTDYLMDMLTTSGYIVLDQHRTGISAGGIQSGELDLDIRLTPGDAWSALEALNLKGSSDSQIEYWNAHLKKLLDNYNDVGRSFLFHVSYVQCPKDKFGRVMSDLYEHMRFYSPRGFELLRRFVSPVLLGNERDQNQFLRAVKCVYDCGGVVMTVYHFFVRIGE